MQIFPGFGGGAPSVPAAPPPPPTREDPAVADSKAKLRQSELKRRGRSASILTSGSGAEDDLGAGIDRPQARAAALLGG